MYTLAHPAGLLVHEGTLYALEQVSFSIHPPIYINVYIHRVTPYIYIYKHTYVMSILSHVCVYARPPGGASGARRHALRIRTGELLFPPTYLHKRIHASVYPIHIQTSTYISRCLYSVMCVYARPPGGSLGARRHAL